MPNSLDLVFEPTGQGLAIVPSYRPRAAGRYRASIAADGAVVRFGQVVLP